MRNGRERAEVIEKKERKGEKEERENEREEEDT